MSEKLEQARGAVRKWLRKAPVPRWRRAGQFTGSRPLPGFEDRWSRAALLNGLAVPMAAVLLLGLFTWMGSATWSAAQTVPRLSTRDPGIGDADLRSGLAGQLSGGEVVVAPPDRGLTVINPATFEMRRETVASTGGGLGSDAVTDLAADAAGRLLTSVMADGRGASVRQADGNWSQLVAPEAIEGSGLEGVVGVLVHEGRLTLVGVDGRILDYSEVGRCLRVVRLSQPLPTPVRHVAQDSAGRLWCCAGDTLARLTPGAAKWDVDLVDLPAGEEAAESTVLGDSLLVRTSRRGLLMRVGSSWQSLLQGRHGDHLDPQNKFRIDEAAGALWSLATRQDGVFLARYVFGERRWQSLRVSESSGRSDTEAVLFEHVPGRGLAFIAAGEHLHSVNLEGGRPQVLHAEIRGTARSLSLGAGQLWLATQSSESDHRRVFSCDPYAWTASEEPRFELHRSSRRLARDAKFVDVVRLREGTFDLVDDRARLWSYDTDLRGFAEPAPLELADASGVRAAAARGRELLIADAAGKTWRSESPWSEEPRVTPFLQSGELGIDPSGSVLLGSADWFRLIGPGGEGWSYDWKNGWVDLKTKFDARGLLRTGEKAWVMRTREGAVQYRNEGSGGWRLFEGGDVEQVFPGRGCVPVHLASGGLGLLWLDAAQVSAQPVIPATKPGTLALPLLEAAKEHGGDLLVADSRGLLSYSWSQHRWKRLLTHESIAWRALESAEATMFLDADGKLAVVEKGVADWRPDTYKDVEVDPKLRLPLFLKESGDLEGNWLPPALPRFPGQAGLSASGPAKSATVAGRRALVVDGEGRSWTYDAQRSSLEIEPRMAGRRIEQVVRGEDADSILALDVAGHVVRVPDAGGDPTPALDEFGGEVVELLDGRADRAEGPVLARTRGGALAMVADTGDRVLAGGKSEAPIERILAAAVIGEELVVSSPSGILRRTPRSRRFERAGAAGVTARRFVVEAGRLFALSREGLSERGADGTFRRRATDDFADVFVRPAGAGYSGLWGVTRGGAVTALERARQRLFGDAEVSTARIVDVLESEAEHGVILVHEDGAITRHDRMHMELRTVLAPGGRWTEQLVDGPDVILRPRVGAVTVLHGQDLSESTTGPVLSAMVQPQRGKVIGHSTTGGIWQHAGRGAWRQLISDTDSLPSSETLVTRACKLGADLYFLTDRAEVCRQSSRSVVTKQIDTGISDIWPVGDELAVQIQQEVRIGRQVLASDVEFVRGDGREIAGVSRQADTDLVWEASGSLRADRRTHPFSMPTCDPADLWWGSSRDAVYILGQSGRLRRFRVPAADWADVADTGMSGAQRIVGSGLQPAMVVSGGAAYDLARNEQVSLTAGPLLAGDGRHYYLTPEGELWSTDGSSARQNYGPRRLLPAGGNARLLADTPSGPFLAFGGSDMRLLTPDGRARTVQGTPPAGPFTGMSGDRDQVWLKDEGGGLWRLDSGRVLSQALEASVSSEVGAGGVFALSVDGDVLAVDAAGRSRTLLRPADLEITGDVWQFSANGPWLRLDQGRLTVRTGKQPAAPWTPLFAGNCDKVLDARVDGQGFAILVMSGRNEVLLQGVWSDRSVLVERVVRSDGAYVSTGGGRRVALGDRGDRSLLWLVDRLTGDLFGYEPPLAGAADGEMRARRYAARGGGLNFQVVDMRIRRDGLGPLEVEVRPGKWETHAARKMSGGGGRSASTVVTLPEGLVAEDACIVGGRLLVAGEIRGRAACFAVEPGLPEAPPESMLCTPPDDLSAAVVDGSVEIRVLGSPIVSLKPGDAAPGFDRRPSVFFTQGRLLALRSWGLVGFDDVARVPTSDGRAWLRTWDGRVLECDAVGPIGSVAAPRLVDPSRFFVQRSDNGPLVLSLSDLEGGRRWSLACDFEEIRLDIGNTGSWSWSQDNGQLRNARPGRRGSALAAAAREGGGLSVDRPLALRAHGDGVALETRAGVFGMSLLGGRARFGAAVVPTQTGWRAPFRDVVLEVSTDTVELRTPERTWRFDRERGVADVDDPVDLFLDGSGSPVLLTRSGAHAQVDRDGQLTVRPEAGKGLEQPRAPPPEDRHFREVGGELQWRLGAESEWVRLGSARRGFAASSRVLDVMPSSRGLVLLTQSAVWFLRDGVRKSVALSDVALLDGRLLSHSQSSGALPVLEVRGELWSVSPAGLRPWSGDRGLLVDHPAMTRGAFGNLEWDFADSGRASFSSMIGAEARPVRLLGDSFEHVVAQALFVKSGKAWVETAVGGMFSVADGEAGAWRRQRAVQEPDPVVERQQLDSSEMMGRWLRSPDGAWTFEMQGLSDNQFHRVEQLPSGQLETSDIGAAASDARATWLWTAAGLIRWGHDGRRALLPVPAPASSAWLAVSEGRLTVRLDDRAYELQGEGLVGVELEDSALSDARLRCVSLQQGPWRAGATAEGWTIEALCEGGQWCDAEIDSAGCWFDQVDERVAVRVAGADVQWRSASGRWVTESIKREGAYARLLTGTQPVAAAPPMVQAEDGVLAVDSRGGLVPIELRRGWNAPVQIPWDVSDGRLPIDRVRDMGIARQGEQLSLGLLTDFGLRTVRWDGEAASQYLAASAGRTGRLLPDPQGSLVFIGSGGAFELDTDGLIWRPASADRLAAARQLELRVALYDGKLVKSFRGASVGLAKHLDGGGLMDLELGDWGFRLDQPEGFFWDETLHRQHAGHVLALGLPTKGWLRADVVAREAVGVVPVLDEGQLRIAVQTRDGTCVRAESGRFDQVVGTPAVGAQTLLHTSLRRQSAPAGVLRIELQGPSQLRPVALEWAKGRWLHEAVHDLAEVVDVTTGREVGILLATQAGLILRDAGSGHVFDRSTAADIRHLETWDGRLLGLGEGREYEVQVGPQLVTRPTSSTRPVPVHTDPVFSIERRVGDGELQLSGLEIEPRTQLVDQEGRLPGDRVDAVAYQDGTLVTSSSRGILWEDLAGSRGLQLLGFAQCQSDRDGASLKHTDMGVLWMSGGDQFLVADGASLRSLSAEQATQLATSEGRSGDWSWRLSPAGVPVFDWQPQGRDREHRVRFVEGAFDIDQAVALLKTRSGPVAMQPSGPMVFSASDRAGDSFPDPQLDGALDDGALLRETAAGRELVLAPVAQRAWDWSGDSGRLEAVPFPVDTKELRQLLVDEGRWMAWMDANDRLQLRDHARDLVVAGSDLMVDGQLVWDVVVDVAASGEELWLLSRCTLERVAGDRLETVRSFEPGSYSACGSYGGELLLQDRDGRRWLGLQSDRQTQEEFDRPGRLWAGDSLRGLRFDGGVLTLDGRGVRIPDGVERAFEAGARLWLVGPSGTYWVRLEARWRSRLAELVVGQDR